MRIATSTLLAGASSASIFSGQQSNLHVLSDGYEAIKPIADYLSASGADGLKSFEEALKGMTSETKALWDEIKMLVPDGFDKSTFFSSPKKHTRKPDTHWDHVVKGADVQKLWVQDDEGGHRKVGGRLDTYNLRVKSVDPSKLGIDTVKQYSGYLDDEANDKHLFYCKFFGGAPFGLHN